MLSASRGKSLMECRTKEEKREGSNERNKNESFSIRSYPSFYLSFFLHETSSSEFTAEYPRDLDGKTEG
jgi:hypothetical protein